MVQIMNESTAGGRLGQAWGEGISRGLSGLAELKLQQMKQAQVAKGLKAMGIPDDKVGALSQLDPQTLNTYLKQVLQEPQNARFAETMQDMLGGGQPQQQPQLNQSYPTQGNAQPVMQSYQPPMQQNAPGSPQVSAMPNQPPQRGAGFPMDKNAQMATTQKPVMVPGLKEPSGQPRGNGLFMDEEEEGRTKQLDTAKQTTQQEEGPTFPPFPKLAGYSKDQQRQLVDIYDRKTQQIQKAWDRNQDRALKKELAATNKEYKERVNEIKERTIESREKMKERGIEAAEKKLEKQQTFGEKQQALAAAQPVIKEITNRHRSLTEQKRMLEEMQELNKKMDESGMTIPIKTLSNFGKKWGIDLTGSLSDQAQAYQKYSSQLAMEKLAAVHGKGSDKDLMAIQESVPNLMMSPEGRELVTKKNLEAVDLGLLELPAMREVYNKGITPTFAMDVEDRYDEMRNKRLKEWAKDYKEKSDKIFERNAKALASGKIRRQAVLANPTENIKFSTDTGI